MSRVSLNDELYMSYPVHVGKGAAYRAIEKAVRRLPLELKLAGKEVADQVAWIKEAVGCFAKSPAGQIDGLFRGYRPPYPATWFNQSRYLDDPEMWFAVSLTRTEEQELKMAAAANVGVWRPK